MKKDLTLHGNWTSTGKTGTFYINMGIACLSHFFHMVDKSLYTSTVITKVNTGAPDIFRGSSLKTLSMDSANIGDTFWKGRENEWKKPKIAVLAIVQQNYYIFRAPVLRAACTLFLVALRHFLTLSFAPEGIVKWIVLYSGATLCKKKASCSLETQWFCYSTVKKYTTFLKGIPSIFQIRR